MPSNLILVARSLKSSRFPMQHFSDSNFNIVRLIRLCNDVSTRLGGVGLLDFINLDASVKSCVVRVSHDFDLVCVAIFLVTMVAGIWADKRSEIRFDFEIWSIRKFTVKSSNK